ncbi:MAG TPA: galactokinase [Candidatus Deferrimicrobium sp.]|nr:galactokinase [Candidatus Deferrimicrobium sp.]
MSSVVDAFRRLTGHVPDGVWSSPGRANLIGEHTDYNQGLVLPWAIDRSARLAIGVRSDRTVRCASRQMAGEVTMAVDDILPGRVEGWARYPFGVLWAMVAAGADVPGCDVVIDSDVPVGAGLGSSAAVEVALALAVAELAGATFTRDELAHLCQAGEQSMAGAPTGLMDPLAVLESQAGYALLLDCRDLSRGLVPFAAGTDVTVLVVDTRVVHDTAGAGYRARREECADAARLLRLPSLREATLAEVDSRLDGVLLRRARHVVTENERVARTAALLRAGQVRRVGPLLTASHASLRDDYQVSCPELDTAVDAAVAAGAWGARMTGAGFGGCAIALLSPASSEAVAEAARAAFARQGYAEPALFAVASADGARRVG